jgi:hypothetical protein
MTSVQLKLWMQERNETYKDDFMGARYMMDHFIIINKNQQLVGPSRHYGTVGT